MARFTILSYEFRTVQDPYDNSLFPTRTDEEKEEIFAHKQDYFDEFFNATIAYNCYGNTTAL